MERLAMEAQNREQPGTPDSPDVVERPKFEKTLKKSLKSSSLNSTLEKEDKKSKKKKKLYCVCQTPYDNSKWDLSKTSKISFY